MSKPAIIKVFSGVFRRALPTKSLTTNEEAAETPIRTPIESIPFLVEIGERLLLGFILLPSGEDHF
jgi:hypothetical protein